MNDIAPPSGPALAALLDPNDLTRPDLRSIEFECLQMRHGGALIGELGTFADSSRAAGTYRTYDTNLLRIKRYAHKIGAIAFPPTSEFVARYIADCATRGIAYSTINSDLSAIEAIARALNVGIGMTRDHVVRTIKRGIARVNGTEATSPKRAWLPDHTRAALPYLEDLARIKPVQAARNLAVLTFGNATAIRRWSFRTLRSDHIEVHPQGLRVSFHETKTRQNAGDVHTVEIRRIRDERICPVVTLLRYIEIARLDGGYVFRPMLPGDRTANRQLNPETISRIVKDTAAAIGLPSAAFGAHSLRAGMITAGTEAGVSTQAIMAISDQRRLATLLKYVRSERMFTADTTARVFE